MSHTKKLAARANGFGNQRAVTWADMTAGNIRRGHSYSELVTALSFCFHVFLTADAPFYQAEVIASLN